MATLHASKLFPSSSSSSGGLAPFTSITHTPHGTFFLTTSPDGTLHLYDSLRGRHAKAIYSKKYGCSNATFTLSSAAHTIPASCVIASTISTTANAVNNNALRLLDLNTNSFTRYFNGHSDQVLSTAASPSTAFGLDAFYTSAADGTIRAWDARSDKCYAAATGMGSMPILALDTSGTLMAVWNNDTKTLHILAVESFPTGIVKSIIVNNVVGTVERVMWAYNGLVVLDVPGENKIVIDTIRADTSAVTSAISTLNGVVPFLVEGEDVWRSGSAGITPDGKWCIAGSGDGALLAWDLTSNEKENEHGSGNVPVRIYDASLVEKNIVPRIVSVNPRLGSVVTGDTEIVISVYSSD